jgi:hypothetical protein
VAERLAEARSGRRAAAEPQRERILAVPRASEGGLDVTELAAMLGLHPNTIRWLGAEIAVASLEPYAEPGVCVARRAARVAWVFTAFLQPSSLYVWASVAPPDAALSSWT